MVQNLCTLEHWAHAQRQPVPQQGSREREGSLSGSGARFGLTEKQSTTGAKRAGRMLGRQLATQILWRFAMKAFVYVSRRILNWIRCSMGSQCNWASIGVAWSNLPGLRTILAQVFCTRCSLPSSTLGKPYRRLLQLSSRDSTSACTKLLALSTSRYCRMRPMQCN